MYIEDLWNLFKQTGKIEYYLKYVDMKKMDVKYLGDNKSRGNSS